MSTSGPAALTDVSTPPPLSSLSSSSSSSSPVSTSPTPHTSLTTSLPSHEQTTASRSTQETSSLATNTLRQDDAAITPASCTSYSTNTAIVPSVPCPNNRKQSSHIVTASDSVSAYPLSSAVHSNSSSFVCTAPVLRSSPSCPSPSSPHSSLPSSSSSSSSNSLLNSPRLAHAKSHSSQPASSNHRPLTNHTKTSRNASTCMNTKSMASTTTSTSHTTNHQRSNVPSSSAYYPLPLSPHPPSQTTYSHISPFFSLSPFCVSAQSILQWGGIRAQTQTDTHTHTGTHTGMLPARHVSTARTGEHLICVHDSEAGIDRVVSAFLRSAIQNHEQAVVFSDRWTEEYLRHLVEMGEQKRSGRYDHEQRGKGAATGYEKAQDRVDSEGFCKGDKKEREEREDASDTKMEEWRMKKKEVTKGRDHDDDGQKKKKLRECVFSEGQLMVLRYNQTCFVAKTEREKSIVQLAQLANHQGFAGVRIIGDTKWIHTHHAVLSGADLIEYEAACNDILEAQATLPIGALCLYDTRIWPANYVLALLQTHPLVVMPESQHIVLNMYYIPPPAFRASPAELRRHVLATMIQQLREQHAGMEEAHAHIQSLAQTKERAQSVAKQQQSIASNDLRRPLDNILSLASTLTMLDPHSPPNEQSRQNMRRFRENVTGLLEIIRDILDLFRMNSGQVHVRVAPFSVRAMLQGIMNNGRELLDERQRQLALPGTTDETSTSCGGSQKSSSPSPSLSSSTPATNTESSSTTAVPPCSSSTPSSSPSSTLSPPLIANPLSSFFVSSSASSMPPVLTRYKPKGGLVDLRLSVDPRISSHLQGDSPKISQIITNLLSNAVKYTNSGVIEIAARVSDDMKLLEVSVRDTGPGIPECVLPRIFQMLMQEDYSHQSGAHAQPHFVGQSSAAIKGTGLGLHVAKRLAEMIGGDLRCESDLGLGSTFTLSVPYTPAHEHEEHGKPWWDISAEEPQENYQLSDEYLQQGQRETSVKEEGKGQKIERGAGGPQHREEQEREVETIKEKTRHSTVKDGGTRRGVQTDAEIEGRSRVEVDNRDYRAGRTLEGQADVSRRVGEGRADNERPSERGHTIEMRQEAEELDRMLVCVLVVEDDAASRRLVTHILARAGYRVIGAETGREAIGCLESEGDSVDIVLLDMHLPDMSCARDISHLAAVSLANSSAHSHSTSFFFVHTIIPRIPARPFESGVDIAIAVRHMERSHNPGQSQQQVPPRAQWAKPDETRSSIHADSDSGGYRNGTIMPRIAMSRAQPPSDYSAFNVSIHTSSSASHSLSTPSTSHSHATEHRRSSTSSACSTSSSSSYVTSPSSVISSPPSAPAQPPSLLIPSTPTSTPHTEPSLSYSQTTHIPTDALHTGSHPSPDILPPANQRAPRRVPIVFLSGQDYESLMDALHASGADDVLRKPVSRQELLDMVGKWASRGKRSKTW